MALLRAADELDQTFNRAHSSALIFKTLLITGNRPTAIFSACVSELHPDRIALAPDAFNKRNGAATILAFVHMAWPVAHRIFSGSPLGFDGRRPTTPEKIAARAHRRESMETLTALIEPEVRRRMERRPMYALRATHISWARNLGVNIDSIRAQVGHGPRDIQEKHYLDPHLVNPAESSQVVFEVLTGARTLRGKAVPATATVPLRLAAGAEQMQEVVLNVAKNVTSEAKSTTESPLSSLQDEGLERVKVVEDTGIEPVTFRLPA